MQRICSSLANNGYDVLLVGRKMNNSSVLIKKNFKQKRLQCLYNNGALFYAEYNVRLFFYLLFIKMHGVCAIDLDTILPCYFVSLLRRKKRVYDAHELFTEMKEVVTRPPIKKQWMKIEKFCVPKFKFGYTVSYSIAEEFNKRYNVTYDVIRNVPVKRELQNSDFKPGDLAHTNAKSGGLAEQKSTNTQNKPGEKIILYQGAINEARGLENLIEAMKQVNGTLHLYGDGNIYKRVERLIQQNNLQHKIFLKGKLEPAQLFATTKQAYIGINLVEPLGLNQLYSLANKFFDYIQAGVPQLTMNFPEYKKVNNEFEVALLINTIDVNEIANALNILLTDDILHKKLKQNCTKASAKFNWQQEEKKLLAFYKQVYTG